MGSVGNQNPWQTYDTYKDCSQGICSIYCPQWCYIIFPPPPPFLLAAEDDDNSSATDFSPLIIAVIGILASAFILVTYYTIISKYCRRRRGSGSGSGGDGFNEWDDEHPQRNNESLQGGNNPSRGLDDSIIKSITVCRYKKGDGFVDGTDCSVCLTEFQENESLRLLPKCSHAFHLPCIDTWLKSHASCPLCRAHIGPANTPTTTPQQQPQPENQESPPATTTTTISAQEYQQRSNDSILVVQELERFVEEEAVVVVDGEDDLTKGEVQEIEIKEDNININTNGMQEMVMMRRSASMNSILSHNQMMSIADILGINDEEEEEDDDDDEIKDVEKNKIGKLNLIRSPLALKRSISTGRFLFMTRYENGRSSSTIPN